MDSLPVVEYLHVFEYLTPDPVQSAPRQHSPDAPTSPPLNGTLQKTLFVAFDTSTIIILANQGVRKYGARRDVEVADESGTGHAGRTFQTESPAH